MQRKFKNQYLDTLIVDTEPHKQVRLLRVFGTGLSRRELAAFLQVDYHSIRRYESEWNTAKIPQWYFHVLRFLSGDLSIYGEEWINTKIKPHNSKITTPYAPYEDFSPMDLNLKYSFIHKEHERIIQQQHKEIESLRAEIFKLKGELKRNLEANNPKVIQFKQV